MLGGAAKFFSLTTKKKKKKKKDNNKKGNLCDDNFVITRIDDCTPFTKEEEPEEEEEEERAVFSLNFTQKREKVTLTFSSDGNDDDDLVIEERHTRKDAEGNKECRSNSDQSSGDPVDQLVSIFPDIPKNTLRNTLVAHDMDLSLAVEALVSMDMPATKEEEEEEEGEGGYENQRDRLNALSGYMGRLLNDDFQATKAQEEEDLKYALSLQQQWETMDNQPSENIDIDADLARALQAQWGEEETKDTDQDLKFAMELQQAFDKQVSSPQSKGKYSHWLDVNRNESLSPSWDGYDKVPNVLPQVDNVDNILSTLPKKKKRIAVLRIVKPSLARRFDAKVAEMIQHGKDPDIRLGFHGTSFKNIQGIVNKGLLIPGQGNSVKKRHGALFGTGIYIGSEAKVAAGYAKGKQGQLLVLAVCLGNKGRCTCSKIPCSKGYDTHEAGSGSNSFWVAKSADQVFPLYVVQYK